MSQTDPIDGDDTELHEAKAEAERRAQKVFDERLSRMAWLMSEQQGRAIVWDVLLQGDVHVDLLDLQRELPRPATEFELGRAQGKQLQALQWFHLLHATPVLLDAYHLMVTENHFAHDQDSG